MSITGKCLCGAIAYSCSAEPALAGNCHCSDCKKASGSGYAPTMFFPDDVVSITGEVKFFGSQAASGNTISRGFCPTCGSQLFGKSEAMPGMLAIRAGSLDDVSVYKPGIDIFTDHAAAWDVMDPDLPKFPGMPPHE